MSIILIILGIQIFIYHSPTSISFLLINLHHYNQQLNLLNKLQNLKIKLLEIRNKI